MAYKKTSETTPSPGLTIREFETIIPWVIKEKPSDRLGSLVYSGQIDTSGTTAESGDNFRITWEEDPDGYALGDLFFELGDRRGYYNISLVHGNLSTVSSETILTFTQIIE